MTLKARKVVRAVIGHAVRGFKWNNIKVNDASLSVMWYNFNHGHQLNLLWVTVNLKAHIESDDLIVVNHFHGLAILRNYATLHAFF